MLIDGYCYAYNNSYLSAGWITLIVVSSLTLAFGIGYAIWAYWKRRRGFMGPLGAATENNGLRATYYQVP